MHEIISELESYFSVPDYPLAAVEVLGEAEDMLPHGELRARIRGWLDNDRPIAPNDLLRDVLAALRQAQETTP